MAKLLKLRRGTTSQHSSFTGAVGEVTVDTDKKVVVVHDGSTAGGVPLATASDVTGKQASDAQLTELATMGATTAEALADLTQAEVQILDDATVTTAELNTLDGFTGDKDDLNYAKDLKATGVTDTEFDYLDGVTSNIQTQLNAKGTGDMTLAGAQTVTGVKTFNAAAVGEVTALTDAATVAVDLSASNHFSLLMTSGVGNSRTLGQPSSQAVGQSGSIFITQDNTGSRTLGYHSDWKWVGGSSEAPTLTTTGNAVDRIDYIVAAANKIHAVASLDIS